jgi:hypothetical protein
MIGASGEWLLWPTRCFAAANGGSGLRRTLTHHPLAGLRRESFGFPQEAVEEAALTRDSIPLRVPTGNLCDMNTITETWFR